MTSDRPNETKILRGEKALDKERGGPWDTECLSILDIMSFHMFRKDIFSDVPGTATWSPGTNVR